MGKNERKEAKMEREAEAQQSAKSKAAKEKEDAIWSAAGEGQKTKAAAKKEEEDKKKAETAARKAEVKRLAELEEAELSRAKAKTAPVAINKVRGLRPGRGVAWGEGDGGGGRQSAPTRRRRGMWRVARGGRGRRRKGEG